MLNRIQAKAPAHHGAFAALECGMIELAKLLYVNLFLSLVAIAFAGWGSFLGAYYKKRGENLATKDDFNSLLNQIEATTEATKKIEHHISDEFWNKQRVWEMKRDTLFALLQSMRETEASVLALAALIAVSPQQPNLSEDVLLREMAKALRAYLDSTTTFEHKRLMAAVVCGPRLNESAWQIHRQMTDYYLTIQDPKTGPDPHFPNSLEPSIAVLESAIREELGVRQN